MVGNTGIPTQRYIFGILALLVVVFVALFYMFIAMRYMRCVLVFMMRSPNCFSGQHQHHRYCLRRRRHMRVLQAQAEAEAEQRHKELLELVERACSVPGKTYSLGANSGSDAPPLPQPSAASFTKLYLTQECPVCLEDVPDTTEWRAFRCGHGLCYPCLCKAVSMATTLAEVKCPICRELVVEGMCEDESPQEVEEASVEGPPVVEERGPPEAGEDEPPRRGIVS